VASVAAKIVFPAGSRHRQPYRFGAANVVDYARRARVVKRELQMKWFLGAAFFVVAGQALAQGGAPATVRPYLWSSERPKSEIGEINVFRRFSSDRTDQMRAFYGEVLGLPVLPQTALGGGQMIRYPVGGSEVKLFPAAPSAPSTAGIKDATGVRLLTFFYADEAAVTRRFTQHGLPPPSFAPTASRRGAKSAALLQDPDGEWVELVVVPGASAEELARFEIGITVGDLAASRAFYGDFMGLTPQAPVRDERLGTERYAFVHGGTTINLWSFGAGLANDAQTAGMQYIVWNVAAIDGVVRERGARVDRPLSAPGQMRTLWLLDPDGVSNYFAEFAGNDNSPRSQ
jgi:catechol 2,3-dioxygenase-like lactoylglutathione lyase family enzyme